MRLKQYSQLLKSGLDTAAVRAVLIPQSCHIMVCAFLSAEEYSCACSVAGQRAARLHEIPPPLTSPASRLKNTKTVSRKKVVPTSATLVPLVVIKRFGTWTTTTRLRRQRSRQPAPESRVPRRSRRIRASWTTGERNFRFSRGFQV